MHHAHFIGKGVNETHSHHLHDVEGILTSRFFSKFQFRSTLLTGITHRFGLHGPLGLQVSHGQSPSFFPVISLTRQRLTTR